MENVIIWLLQLFLYDKVITNGPATLNLIEDLEKNDKEITQLT